MMLIRKRFAIALIPLVILLFHCSPQFTPGKKDKEDSNSDSGGQVGEEGATVTDDATGSSLAVPPGALAVGSNVAVTAATAPDEFAVSENVSAASAAIQVNGTDPSGAALANAQSPMTLNIPLDGGAGLALTGVEKSIDNLCTFLKSGSGDLFVWRRSQLSVNDAANMVTIQTYYFGVFQLVYCGKETLPGFKDPTATGIPNDTMYSLTMSIPADIPNLSQDKYCGFVIRTTCTKDDDNESCDDDNDAFIAAAEVAANAGKEVKLAFEFGASVMNDNPVYVGAGFNSAGKPCNFEPGKKLNEVDWNHNQLFAFAVEAEDAKTNISASLGGTGPFQIAWGDLPIGIGKPGAPNTSIPNHADAKVCIEVEWKDPGHLVSYSASISADGKINGSSSFALPIPEGGTPAANKYMRVNVTIGGSCFDGDKGDVNSATGKPYRVEFKDPDLNGGEVWLTPIQLTLGAVFDTAPLPAGTNVCLDVAKGGTMIQNGGDNLANYQVAADAGSYYVFLPYLDTEKYDMHLEIVSSGCNEEERQQIQLQAPWDTLLPTSQMLPNKPLNPTITIPDPG